MNCPKCGKSTPASSSECPFCGIVFAKFKKSPTPSGSGNIDDSVNARLTTCPDCNKEISKRAQSCPHCGAPTTRDSIQKPENQIYPMAPPSPRVKILSTVFSLFVILAVFSSIFSQKHERQAPPAPPDYVNLNAKISFTGTQFTIQNNDNFNWQDVEFELNCPGMFSSGYKFHADNILANTEYAVGVMQFANSEGLRFNPLQMKPQSMMIRCIAKNGARGIYTGTWD